MSRPKKSRNLSTPNKLQTREPLGFARTSVVRRFEHLANDRKFRLFTTDELSLKKKDLTEVEDKRRIPHEYKHERIPRNIDGTAARYGRAEEIQRRLRGLSVQMRPRFFDPEKVVVCLRRSIRKRIMFALQKAGRGGQKRPRWNEDSYIRCH